MAEDTKDLEVQARDAVLSLIKANADKATGMHPNGGEVARNLAAAYALVTGQAAPDADTVTKLVGKMS